MKYTLYKPNSKNTGAAFSFEVNKQKNGYYGLFVSMVKQNGWNADKKTGTFSGGSTGTIKLSVNEAGEIISSIDNRLPFSAFHKMNDDSTSILFSLYDKKRKVGNEEIVSPAFGFSVTKNSSDKYQVGVEAGEAQAIKVLLQNYILLAIEEEMKIAKAKYEGKNGNSNGNKNNSRQAPAQQPEPEEEDEDDIPF